MGKMLGRRAQTKLLLRIKRTVKYGDGAGEIASSFLYEGFWCVELYPTHLTVARGCGNWMREMKRPADNPLGYLQPPGRLRTLVGFHSPREDITIGVYTRV